MALTRLARELEETARQSAEMVDAIAAAVTLLTDPDIGDHEARAEAARMIVTALQGQDRIEQRCRNLAVAARQLSAPNRGNAPADSDAVWSSLKLDELRIKALSGIAARGVHGEAEFF